MADIHKRGIILSGGGALLKDLDLLVKKETKVPVVIIDDPLTTVVRGTGLILEDLDGLQDVLIPSAR